MKLNFRPWFGRQYLRQGFHGKRFLILTPFHHGDPGAEPRDKTVELIRSVRDSEITDRYFDTLQKLLEPFPKRRLSASDRSRFWDSVALATVIQSHVGASSGWKPTPLMWHAAPAAARLIIAQTEPTVVIAVGADLLEHIAPVQDHRLVLACANPLYPSFKIKSQRSQIHSAIEEGTPHWAYEK